VLSLLNALLVFGSMAWLPPAGGTANSVSQPTRVAIAPIAYSNVIPHHTRDAVRAVLGEAVQKIATNSLLLDVDAECRTRECVLRQARDAHAELLLELRLTLEQRDYAIEIVMLEASEGRPLAKVEGVCRLCAQAELLSEIAAQVMSLQESLEAQPVARSEVQVEEAAGDDYLPARPRHVGPRPGLMTAGWVSFSLGIAGVGVGATLISLDGREHGPTCGVEVRDVQGGCPNVYTTNLAGLVSAGLGGAALVTGVGLLIAGGGRRDRGVRARISPALGGLRVQF
jgi:hypothetical protein